MNITDALTVEAWINPSGWGEFPTLGYGRVVDKRQMNLFLPFWQRLLITVVGIMRKAQVVAAVRGGLLSLDDACSRYRLTVDEFLNWQQSIESHGLAVLRTIKIQDYRAGL